MDEIVSAHQSVEPSPRSGRCAHEGERLVIHLVTAIRLERFLNPNDVLNIAREEDPLIARFESRGVFPETGGRVVLGVDRNGNHAHLIQLRTEPFLRRRKRGGHNWTHSRASGENELEDGGTLVIQERGKLD